MRELEIKGFRQDPKLNARGNIYRGRFTCSDVQWTGEGDDILATFTITADELADVAESHLIWTDQDVQRGILPEASPTPKRELALGDGYPDPNLYIFSADNADDIVEKLLRGERLFLSPLVWNLRPGTFEAYWDPSEESIFLYEGKIYLPDSHHRQQAIFKAVLAYRDSPSSYPKFSPAKQFKVELYFLSKEDEGNYFFDKNQRTRPTAMSKAYDLTTMDDLSLLAKRVIDKSNALRDNVNRVTDRLTYKNPQVMTLSTLREMMRSFAPTDSLDEPELEGLATVAATFYDLLAEVRPELGQIDAKARRDLRDRSMVAQAVMMHGYASLMRDFNDSIAEKGATGATNEWRTLLRRLKADEVYFCDGWKGDLFEKDNPLWRQVGILKPTAKGRLTISNTGATRAECGRVLRDLLALNKNFHDLRNFATS